MAIEVGNVLEGRVTGVKPFGAFVALPEGKSGMVHISEVSNEYVQDINTVLHDGDAVKVQVINIAPDGKIALSIKRLLPPAPRQPRSDRGPRPGGPRQNGPREGGHFGNSRGGGRPPREGGRGPARDAAPRVWQPKAPAKSDNLSFEDMDRIVTEGEALGIHWYMCTGGEPPCRKEDLFKLAAKHQNSVFHLFTNGTLIDQAFCDRVKEVGNMAFFISIEGIGDATDARRGEGVYDRVMHAMDLMKENGLLFGTSICYTSANYKAVTSDEFMDMLISHGVRFNWYFHYMPIGDGANVDLMLNAEQREYMIHRVREIRGYTGGKPIFGIDFQNDGEFVGGCIAGGRQYAHINPAGDVEPCVFIHYSNANIHDKSLLECLQQPLFKEYHKGQPFNHNHLRPCPMLENPELLGEMVKRSGAHSTDMQQPESTDDVFRRCRPYADQWTPSADRIWAEEHPDCASCASCSACASK